MTAITVNWVAPDAARWQPGKAVTSGFAQDTWDNLQFLKEWMGANYIAGAVADHNHDGVNSALIELLPNLVKNGSAELVSAGQPEGWTFTNYTGGSGAASSSARAHGSYSFSITSTVLANGGGYYESDQLFAVGGDERYPWKLLRWASVAGVSNKIEIIWYDGDKSQISITTLSSDTDTPTTATLASGYVDAPAAARWARLRMTGGVPAVGAAVGTVYFDGALIPEVVPIHGISPDRIAPGPVGDYRLHKHTRTTTASGPANVPAKTHEMRVLSAGTLRCRLWLTHSGGGRGYARVYKNGVAYGGVLSADNQTTSRSDDLYFEAGDLIQVYQWNDNNYSDLGNLTYEVTGDSVMLPIQSRSYFYVEIA